MTVEAVSSDEELYDVAFSLLAKRVVDLIDQPPDSRSRTAAQLEQVLGNRLFRLNEPSIEEAIPDAVYERAGLAKENVLEELRALRDDYQGLHAAKRAVSRQLADALTEDDLDSLGCIREAVERGLAAVPDGTPGAA